MHLEILIIFLGCGFFGSCFLELTLESLWCCSLHPLPTSPRFYSTILLRLKFQGELLVLRREGKLLSDSSLITFQILGVTEVCAYSLAWWNFDPWSLHAFMNTHIFSSYNINIKTCLITLGHCICILFRGTFKVRVALFLFWERQW